MSHFKKNENVVCADVSRFNKENVDKPTEN